MIKVLTISTVGLGLYGITNSIMNYYRDIDKSDMQMDFLVPNEVLENLKDEIKSNGGIVYEKIGRNTHPLLYMFRLAKIIKYGKYDIIHAHGNSATLAIEMKVAKICGVKVRIAHCHNSTCNHMFSHKLLKNLFYRSFTHAFACSEKAGKWIYGEIPFTIINNGIPITKFSYNEKERMECRKKLGFEQNKVIGHIGHFSYQKNHEFLIKIFFELYKLDNSYRLLLIGDGSLRDEIKKQVVNLGLSNVVCLFGETLDVSKLLQAMDIFVFPSRFEGLGMAVIEAQSVGLPCIVSDAVPREAKISHGLEFISLQESIQIWVNNILELNQVEREEYFEQTREIILNSNYNIQTESIKLKNLYLDYVF